jgi:hypothetical protein
MQSDSSGIPRHVPRDLLVQFSIQRKLRKLKKIKESYVGGPRHAAARWGEHLSSGQHYKLFTG